MSDDERQCGAASPAALSKAVRVSTKSYVVRSSGNSGWSSSTISSKKAPMITLVSTGLLVVVR
ncbi:hypothetical protein [Streptomyces sp. NPDC055105]|uniref:hypothetical protein n=1 Tax=Streptomyces sp. NPDC055105 TaxID=3365719 RepID=UPI0037D0B4FE